MSESIRITHKILLSQTLDEKNHSANHNSAQNVDPVTEIPTLSLINITQLSFGYIIILLVQRLSELLNWIDHNIQIFQFHLSFYSLSFL